MKRYLSILAVCLLISLPACDHQSAQKTLANSPEGDVVMTGGYTTVASDSGRPVRLIAAALNVEEQVFRDAFSGVTPSRAGPPSPSHARANKKILMDALGKHGISNERLDEVSNYYRYRPQSGELWTHTPAAATAVIENGEVVSVTITDAGSGYMEAPTMQIAGHEDAKLEAEIEFTTNLKTNGRLKSVKFLRPQSSAQDTADPEHTDQEGSDG